MFAESSGWLVRAGCQHCRNVRRNGPAAGMHFPNHSNQVLGNGIFQEVSDSACLKGTIDVLVAVVHRQHDDAGVGLRPAESLESSATRSFLEVGGPSTSRRDGAVKTARLPPRRDWPPQ